MKNKAPAWVVVGLVAGLTLGSIGVASAAPVADPATGELVSAAMAGETLRYTLSLRSIDEPFAGLRFYDDLGVLNALPAFEPGSLTLVSYPP